ncbi:MAG: RidA family protein [Alphaproteobacteria bacterium]|nr:RidA family protein [Alphaproteobacteria bacterium]
MRRAVDTGLPKLKAPLEWATTAGGVFYTAQVPIRADGGVETGDAKAQVDLTLRNLKQAVEAAGGTMDDVTQVLVYLTGAEHGAALNEAWPRFFNAPYPNRATVIVSGLVVPGIVVEIVAHAHIGA